MDIAFFPLMIQIFYRHNKYFFFCELIKSSLQQITLHFLILGYNFVENFDIFFFLNLDYVWVNKCIHKKFSLHEKNIHPGFF